jgi:hypothetical protein
MLQSALVPGGQDTYVNVDGSISVTVQHSHSFPPGSWPEYYGWTWTPLSANDDSEDVMDDCLEGNDRYNCDAPDGFLTFKAPNATLGGVMVCDNKFSSDLQSIWAVTPEFNGTGCFEIVGLGTHNYTGPNPPVWSYY